MVNRLRSEHQEALVKVRREKEKAVAQMKTCFEKEKQVLEDRIDTERSRIDRTFNHGYTSLNEGFKSGFHQNNLSQYQSTTNILDELNDPQDPTTGTLQKRKSHGNLRAEFVQVSLSKAKPNLVVVVVVVVAVVVVVVAEVVVVVES